ncbi:MAG: hypothetical protein WKF47_18880 [Geodermatophilaceae bacterium]
MVVYAGVRPQLQRPAYQLGRQASPARMSVRCGTTSRGFAAPSSTSKWLGTSFITSMWCRAK